MKPDQSNPTVLDPFGRPLPGPGGRPRISLFGLFLIVFGLLLAAGELMSQAELMSSAFFLAIGIALLALGVRERSDLALYAGVLVTGLALAGLLTSPGLNALRGPGWGSVFVGVGVAGIAFVRWVTTRKNLLILALGAILAFWGATEVLQTYSDFPANRLIGPLVLVALGIYIVSRRGLFRWI